MKAATTIIVVDNSTAVKAVTAMAGTRNAVVQGPTALMIRTAISVVWSSTAIAVSRRKEHR